MQKIHVYYVKDISSYWKSNHVNNHNVDITNNPVKKHKLEVIKVPGVLRLPKQLTFRTHDGHAQELIPLPNEETIAPITLETVEIMRYDREDNDKTKIINEEIEQSEEKEQESIETNYTLGYEEPIEVGTTQIVNQEHLDLEQSEEEEQEQKIREPVDISSILTAANPEANGVKESSSSKKQGKKRIDSTLERRNISYVTKNQKQTQKGNKRRKLLLEVPEKINNLKIPQFFSSDKKIMLRTTINSKFISFELDTGASTSVLSHDILSAVNKNYHQNLKMYKTTFTLTGVTGNNLEIKGVYKIPITVPTVGTVDLNIAIVNEPNIRLLGRDFFYATGLSLLFSGNKYKIAFDKNKVNTMDPHERIIFNENEIRLGANQAVFENIQIGNVPRGHYEAKLLDRPTGVVMPDSIVKILKRNGKSTTKIGLGNTLDREIIIPKHALKIRIIILKEDEVNYVGYKEIDTGQLNAEIILNKGNCKLEGLRPYYQAKGDRHTRRPQEFQINKVCLKCVQEEVTIKNIESIHESHSKSSKNIEQIGTNAEKLSPDSIDEGFPIFDKEYNDILYTKEGDELMNGELSVPIPPTEEEIKIEIDNICKKYPLEIATLLRPVLEKNQRLLKNAYDLPVCKEKLHFELKNPIKRNTKVYPIKPGIAESFFSTLQFMVYYGILRRAEAHESFGVPTFAIERKPPAGADPTFSKPIRILADLRDNNAQIRGSLSASMSSCIDILRTLAQDCKYLSLLDISNCFYSVPMSEEVLKTGYNNILTPWGAFVCTRALSGNSIVPSFVTNYLQKVLFMDSEGVSQFLSSVFSFYDDISVKSFKGESKISHFQKLALVIERISESGFQLNLSKSFYCIDLETDSLEVLGYKVSSNKLQITSKRKEDILAVLHRPKNLKSLQKICGILNYVRSCLSLDELKWLSKLSTFSEKNVLTWNPEGDIILENLKKSIAKSDMEVLVPPRNSINILYTDSSDHTIAGILFFCPLSIFETSDDFPAICTRDSKIENHILKYNIPCKAISEVIPTALEFCTKIFYIYNPSINPSLNNMSKLIIKELISMTPILLQKCENASEFQKIIKGIEKPSNDPLIDHYVMHCLSRILGRPILMMINLGYDMVVPYIVEGNYDGLSPVLISVTEKGFQLHGLIEEYDEQKKFSKVTIDQLPLTSIQTIFQKGYKDNLFTFGGCFGRRLPESFKSSPIHCKELAALWEGLKYFSAFVQMRHTVAVMDNSIVVHSLKSYKNRENNKMFRLGMAIGSDYPNLRICLCSTINMKADILTRLFEPNTSSHAKPLPIVDLSTYLDKVKIDDSVVTDPCLNVERKINYVSPLTFKYGFENICTPDNIALQTKLEHSDLSKSDKYTMEEGILKNKVTGKIFLPHNLYGAYILKEHVTQGHEGQTKIMETIRNIYDIQDLAKLRKETKMLIGACMSCISSKATFGKQIAFNSNYGTEIGKSISIDIVEFNKGVKIAKGQYNILGILIVMDNVTSYTSCYYLSEFTTGAVINALLNYFSVQPIPKYLLSDNASIFVNNKFKNFLNLFNIRQVNSAPIHSESRGKVERNIGHFRQFSRIFKIQMPNIRPELSYVFATKFKNKNKIKGLPVSPSFLNCYSDNNYVYHKDFKSSILEDMNAKIALGTEAKADAERISATEMYNKAMEIKSKLHTERMRKLNKNKYNHKFAVGSVVAIKNFDRKSKHQPMYIFEPYLVIEVRRKLLIIESLISGVVKKRHVAHAKFIGTVEGLNLPHELLVRNKLYGPEMLEIMREGYLKDKNKVGTRYTRSKTTKVDTEEEEFEGLGEDDSDDDRHVHFELA